MSVNTRLNVGDVMTLRYVNITLHHDAMTS